MEGKGIFALVIVLILFLTLLNIPTSSAAASEVYGLAAMSQFDRLPYLKLDTISGGFSSHDKAGTGDHDGTNYLYAIGSEKVIAELNGKGSIYRMWFTGFVTGTDYIKVYFDGESTPRINMLLKDMFTGNTAPFLSPLVADNLKSSGGYTSYLPLPFSSSIKIVSNATGVDLPPNGSFFYNIGYHMFSPDTPVTTWTGNEDSTAVRNLWNNAGLDPKSNTGNTTESGTLNVAAGATQNLLDVSGSRSISSIKLNIPGIIPNVTDDGRAFTGYSQFRMAINSNNQGVTLKRRLDYSVANQKAGVYVDGAYAGDWYTSGSDGTNKWRDSTFFISPSFTAGKTSIIVKVQFINTAPDWNEFYYWAYCGSVITDTIDVGNTASESGHSYVINTQTWTGTRPSEGEFIPNTFKYPNIYQVTDDGRAHKGFSQFSMNVPANNSGITLKRRMDFGVANQKAGVYVDGAYVGDWYNSGSDATNRWVDSSFSIPSSFTANKTSITVKIQFVSSAIDWNEFYYWAYSGSTLTDSLDVGNPTSEVAHSYTINTQSWSGTSTMNYLYIDNLDLLNNTWIKIYWDNETTPSVNAPLGDFFAMGHYGAYGTKSLAVGVDASTGTMYMYFPMPFATRAKIDLVNSRSSATNGIYYEIKHKAFTDSFTNVGYFKTNYRTELPSTAGRDLLFLDTDGSGSVVGVVQSVDGIDTDVGGWERSYLEGDERIYIDDSNTPQIYGTGTEDFYDSGWYFKYGLYSRPVSGNPSHLYNSTTKLDSTAMYKLFLADAITFKKHIRLGIEHGPTNNKTVNAYLLTYYYHKPAARSTLTDTLDVGNTTSENSHAYSINTQTWNGSASYQYEGDNDDVTITHSGKAHTGYSQFNLAIASSNTGVMLRRMFDYGIKNQKSDVYVDGTKIGTWLAAGFNPSKRWREDEFLIPAAYTNGKTSITVKIQFVSSDLDWNEFKYTAYTLK